MENLEKIIEWLKTQKAPFEDKKLNRENWKSEFGQNREVNTPIGVVKMGKDQFYRLIKKHRQKYFGLIKPTLENPLLILASPENSLSFIKTFAHFKYEDRLLYFLSVAVSIDNQEIIITNYPPTPKDIADLLEKGILRYASDEEIKAFFEE